ncbi:MAG: hypothetical protein IJS84_03990 [Spirochaetales bacterium]|nr:hypothetical protein [Spirochaetales bacterium]
MKLFSIFKSRDKPVTNRTAGSAYSFFMGGGSSAGKNVNERSAMQGIFSHTMEKGSCCLKNLSICQ